MPQRAVPYCQRCITDRAYLPPCPLCSSPSVLVSGVRPVRGTPVVILQLGGGSVGQLRVVPLPHQAILLGASIIVRLILRVPVVKEHEESVEHEEEDEGVLHREEDVHVAVDVILDEEEEAQDEERAVLETHTHITLLMHTRTLAQTKAVSTPITVVYCLQLVWQLELTISKMSFNVVS